MKIVVAIIVTAVVSVSATLVLSKTSNQVKTAEAKEEESAKHDEEVAKLRAEIAKLERNAQPVVITDPAIVQPGVETPDVVTDPSELIDRLADDGTTGEDVESQRRVIHYFESLVDSGNNSVGAISAFLDQHKDKEFGRPSFRQRLQITNSQVEEFRALNEKIRPQIGEKMREIWGNQEISREERGEQMRAYFEGVRAQYTELMTESQQAQIEEMGEDGQRAIRSLIGGFGGGRDRGRR